MYISMIFSPLEQFKIKPLVIINIDWLDFTFTTINLYTTIIVVLIIIFLQLSIFNISPYISTRWQSIVELLYNFILTLVFSNIGKKGSNFIPFIFTLFLFITFSNLLGLIPYSTAITAQLILTFGIAFSIFIGNIIFGFRNHKIYLFSSLLPEGVPMGLAPLLSVIEYISYLFRPISLSVRLFANMMAGHTLFIIGVSFAWTMFSSLIGIFGSLVISVLLLAFLCLEIGVALLQAYVFTLLICMYISNSLYLDH